MSKPKLNSAWYAIHTYSGYEDKVKDGIMQRAESLGLKHKINEVLVPKEKQIEIKNGKRRVVERKIFQGYVLVNMSMDEEAWFMVRNTQGVTGFVGSGSDPSPMSDEEVAKIMKRMGIEDPKHKLDFSIGEVVNIIDGPLKGFQGAINEVDDQKGKIRVLVSMFGRETPVELDGLQVTKL